MTDKRPNHSDILRQDYKGYMEPLLLSGCNYQAEKLKITRSKYIRYAVINQLIRDGFPLNSISSKFNAFYKGMTSNRQLGKIAAEIKIIGARYEHEGTLGESTQGMSTFGGGHHNDGKLDAFRHGMETVFNMLQSTNNYVFRSDIERIAEMLAMKERDFIIEFISRTLKERARDYKESAATVA